MNQPVAEHRNSALWYAVDQIVSELKTTGEISVQTAPDYVVAYICRELAARKLVSGAALDGRQGRQGRSE